MEPLNPDLVAELRKHVTTARTLGFALCFAAPAVYLFLLVQAALHGNRQPLFAGFHGVPWGDLRIIILCSLGLAALAAGPMLSAGFWTRANNAATTDELFAQLRTGHIVHAMMLESVAVFGLVLGFAVGQKAAPLSLLMILATPVGYVLLVPGARSWMRLISLRAQALPGGRRGPA